VGAVVLAAGGLGAYLAAGSEHERAKGFCSRLVSTSSTACDSEKNNVRAWDWVAASAWAAAALSATVAAYSWTASTRRAADRGEVQVLLGAGSIGVGGSFCHARERVGHNRSRVAGLRGGADRVFDVFHSTGDVLTACEIDATTRGCATAGKLDAMAIEGGVPDFCSWTPDQARQHAHACAWLGAPAKLPWARTPSAPACSVGSSRLRLRGEPKPPRQREDARPLGVPGAR
jgi:hypothetical protein